MQIRTALKQTRSVSYTLAAPIKGLNVRDSLADMEALYAITMDNYIPLDTKVALRPGYTEYLKTTDPVRTLAEYRSGGNRKFLAIIGNKLSNISSHTTPIVCRRFIMLMMTGLSTLKTGDSAAKIWCRKKW